MLGIGADHSTLSGENLATRLFTLIEIAALEVKIPLILVIEL